MALKTSLQQEKEIFMFMLKKPEYLLEVKKDFFTNDDLQYVAVTARDFYKKFREAPSCEQMKRLIKDNDKNITDETVDNIYSVDILSLDQDWLMNTTEGWIMWRAFNTNLVKSAAYIKTVDVSAENVRDVVKRATDMVSDTSLISFDKNMGKNFFDVDSHKSIRENKIPFTWDYWNSISSGGLDPKTLHVYIGFTNVGKSIVLCNDAANYVRQGKNVLFITCEMAKEKVTRRISANLFDMKLEDYDRLVEDQSKVKKKIKQFRSSSFFEPGKLRIKELPTGQGTVLDIERYIKEVEETMKYKVDVVIIDYINIMCNYRQPNSENTYLKIKTLAEDLRGLAVKYDVLMITASQIGRGALDSSDINLTDVSESMGLMHTVDNCIGIIQTEDMRIGELIDGTAVPYYWMKILKIREGEGKGHKFRVDINYDKMKLIERTDCVDTNDHLG